MVLDGNLQVYAGKEKFSSVKGPWDVFCRNVLEDRKSVELDFTATVLSDKPARILSIDLALYTRYLGDGEITPATGLRKPGGMHPPQRGASYPNLAAANLAAANLAAAANGGSGGGAHSKKGNAFSTWMIHQQAKTSPINGPMHSAVEKTWSLKKTSEEETSAGPEEENVQASRSLPASPKRRTTDARGAAQLRSADNSPNLTTATRDTRTHRARRSA
ncbi:hypothetical protein T484DRAFT_2217562 [Baffinella frigidus]|nr:hypothetical protein T484DRAFT_2217562 [Cryptophyta sp. CCMP2293]